MSIGSTRIGVTLGDPAGIGPEIVAKALVSLDEKSRSRFMVFGDRAPFFHWLETLGAGDLGIQFHDTGVLGEVELRAGEPCALSGRAQVSYLVAAVAAAKRGEIGAIATAPISKVWAQAAGFAFPGHTEYLAHAFGCEQVAMLFAGPTLKVVLATVHVSLVDVPKLLSAERIVAIARLATDALIGDFGCQQPRIGVLGLNPHAGEAGKFGDEETRIIAPAIRQLREHYGERAIFEGPLVPDAAFRMPMDLFVAMYHDQGLLPVKLIDFDDSVNTTLGLPIVRTSPDHGVAYDIAGRGIARSTSMEAAMRLAAQLVDRRARRQANSRGRDDAS